MIINIWKEWKRRSFKWEIFLQERRRRRRRELRRQWHRRSSREQQIRSKSCCVRKILVEQKKHFYQTNKFLWSETRSDKRQKSYGSTGSSKKVPICQNLSQNCWQWPYKIGIRETARTAFVFTVGVFHRELLVLHERARTVVRWWWAVENKNDRCENKTTTVTGKTVANENSLSPFLSQPKLLISLLDWCVWFKASHKKKWKEIKERIEK